MINEMLISKEDRDAIRKKERLRKEGETFIKVFNYGPPGFNHIHAIEDINLIEHHDPDTGRTRYDKKIGGGVLTFEEDVASGDMAADVLDTEFNRYFLSRHLELVEKDGTSTPLLVIESKKIAREVKALVNKEFVVEPTRKELLRRKMKAAERELTKIKHEEERERKLDREDQMKSDEKLRVIKEKKKETVEQPVLSSPEKGV